MRGRSVGLTLLLLLLASAAPVLAQTPSGEISGTVADSSGLYWAANGAIFRLVSAPR